MLPNAQLVLLEGGRHVPIGELAEPTIAAITAFIDGVLGKAKPVEPQQSESLPHGTAVILFLDIAGSTALTSKLGDAAYRERERELDTSLRSAISDAGGTPVERSR